MTGQGPEAGRRGLVWFDVKRNEGIPMGNLGLSTTGWRVMSSASGKSYISAMRVRGLVNFVFECSVVMPYGWSCASERGKAARKEPS
jgi:hypothetical protein